jgi:hypothetical protein
MYAWSVQGGYAYGSGRYCGIQVVDVSTPSNPLYETSYGMSGRSYEHSDINGNYLYAAAHTHGIEIVDISNPLSPQSVSSFPAENAWAVDEYQGLLYVADGQAGLKIIDVSNPQQPILLGQAGGSGTAKDVVAQGNYAFLAVGAGGVDMFDVSDPYQPTLVANYNTSGYASRIALSDSLIAVSDWDDVEVLKWDDSPSLSLAGYKSTDGRVMAINMVDDIVFSAEWTLFRTFRFGPITEPDLDLSLHTMDFPHTEIDSCDDSTFNLANNGQTDLLLNATMIGSDFNFNFPDTVLAPGELIQGKVTYCATNEDASGLLSIQSNDPDENNISVFLRGNTPWGVEAGEAAPDFTLSSVNGFGDITLSELLGKVIVVSFFATW